MPADVRDPDAEELLGELLDLHGEGLVRILEALAAAPSLRDEVVADPVVAQMLLVHGLHPVPLDERVAGALERVRPYLASHGGDVELVSLEDGVARIRLRGSCDGCAASASTLELAIERALEEDAPDLLGLEVDGAVEGRAAPAKLLPLAGPAWVDLDAAPDPDGVVAAPLDLVVANVSGTLLAYRDACPGCDGRLAGGELEGGVLACPSCARQYALTLAGRQVGGEGLQLRPVPLLESGGRARVAVPA
jgi:Fe-S cluster biogenesis protein NfuA/nitrite reductase/ring-hydroxylating ferredoxin subunit